MKTILVAVYGGAALLALLGSWVYPAAKLGAQLAAGAFALHLALALVVALRPLLDAGKIAAWCWQGMSALAVAGLLLTHALRQEGGWLLAAAALMGFTVLVTLVLALNAERPESKFLSVCLELLAPGGHFIATAPANQMMGHGFYQFSPELFFRVFNRENGFVIRKLVLFKGSSTDATFYEVNDPAVVGGRVELISSGPVLLGVLAQKITDAPFLSRTPQQSDYEVGWQKWQAAPASPRAPAGRLEKWRAALSPYSPLWLRIWKQRLLYRLKNGPPSFRNTRCYRRISRDELFRK